VGTYRHEVIAKSRVASAAIGLAALTAVLVYAVTDDNVLATTCDVAVAVGACIGAWIGAQRAPRGQRLVPGLIAAGILLSMLGHVLLGVLDSIGAETDVSIADIPWLASYLVFGAAMWIVLRRSRDRIAHHADVDFLIDALTILVVTVLIIWSLSIDAIAADHSVPPFTRMVWAAYPLASSVLFALVVRVLLSRSARAAIGFSFGVAAGLVLVANLIYLQAPQGGAALVLMNAAWMLAPAMAAYSVWRIREIRPDSSGAPGLAGWALVLAIGPLFVPGMLELVTDLRGKPDQPLELFIGIVLLGTLAFVRTARLIRSEGRARHELEAARDGAVEASLAKSMFLANMSHEIRSPLTTVLAAGEILEDTPLDEVQRHLLGKMHRAGDRLKTLVEGILDFSRIEAGELVLASTPFDLHAMVTDAADVYELKAIEAGIGFEWHLDPCAPRMVVGDVGRLFQVLTNVLDNALKFTEQGQVGLVVRPTNTDDQGGGAEGVEFLVNDTGIGIREEDQESVFESYRQLDGSTTRRYGGNGLGLAICRELTELMGGSITVQSQIGVGSTFLIRIPLAPPVGETAPDNAVPVLI
jgi:signal transduction histidine kinase